jgi:hypothetical protein
VGFGSGWIESGEVLAGTQMTTPEARQLEGHLQRRRRDPVLGKTRQSKVGLPAWARGPAADRPA